MSVAKKARELLRDLELEAGSADAEIVGMIREKAFEVFAGNCAFADDDLRLMAGCAKWALLNGIPDETNDWIIPRAKAALGVPGCKWKGGTVGDRALFAACARWAST